MRSLRLYSANSRDCRTHVQSPADSSFSYAPLFDALQIMILFWDLLAQVSTIYVGGISFDTDEKSLQNYFEKFGVVLETKACVSLVS